MGGKKICACLLLFIFITYVYLFSIRESMTSADVEITHNMNTIKIEKLKKESNKYQKDIDTAYKRLEENETKISKTNIDVREFLCETDEKYEKLC